LRFALRARPASIEEAAAKLSGHAAAGTVSLSLMDKASQVRECSTGDASDKALLAMVNQITPVEFVRCQFEVRAPLTAM
jgi:hypothetical protein